MSRSSKKLDHLPLNLKVLTVSLRDSYTASEKIEQLFSQSKKSLHETTSFNLIASQHRSQRDRKLKAGNPLSTVLAKYIKIVHLVFCESFNGRHNKYSDRFHLEKRGDMLNIRYIKDFPEPVGNETETSLSSKNISMALCCSSLKVSIPKVAQTCLKISSFGSPVH